MELQEAFQAWEDALLSFRVQLQVLPQLPDVHVPQDLQGPYVVHLCLHQLCSDTQLLSECTGVLPTDLIGLDLDVFECPKKRYIIIIIVDYPASVSHFFVFKGNFKKKKEKLAIFVKC